MLSVEQALVFGPPSDDIVNCLIAVSSIGTVAFFFECGNFLKKVYAGEELIPRDIAQIISLFAEEVPQITLNVLLASCREIPMSYYALVKAALAMFGGCLRATTLFFDYLRPRKKAQRRGLIPWLYRTVILVACIYTFIGACLVWVYTYTEPGDSQSGSGFRPPDSISKSYDTDRYLYKSGVFFSHRNFADCYGNDGAWFDRRLLWTQFVPIYDVTDAAGKEVEASFVYNEFENFVSVKVPGVLGTDGFQSYETCFHTDLTGNCSVTKRPIIDCVTAAASSNDSVEFIFYSTPKTKTIVFGDVKMKVAAIVNGTCIKPEVDAIGNLVIDRDIVGQVQYFRLKQDINDSLTSNFLLDGSYRYYIYDTDADITEQAFMPYNIPWGDSPLFPSDNVPSSDEGDLLNVTAEWKTGYNQCDMTGSLRPNPDPNDNLCDDLDLYAL